MRLENADLLYLLIVPAAAVLFFVWSFRSRRAAAEKLIKNELQVRLAPSYAPGRLRLKAALMVAVLLFSVIALMRPQYGFHIREIKKKGLDILFALDISKSMLAEDIKPSRIERTKLAIEDLVRGLKGDRVGLITFAGTAFLQCPLTMDYDGFLLSLDRTKVGDIPRGGTAISSAVREAMTVFGQGKQKHKIVILITDGEDHEGDPVGLAKEAAKEGITIFTIGIGTEEGELIPLRDENGKLVFLKDRSGNVVKSALNSGVLEKIALTTGGSFVRAANAEFGLNLLYKERLSGFEKEELRSKMQKKYDERFQMPLAAAVILLLIESFLGDRKRAHGL